MNQLLEQLHKTAKIAENTDRRIAVICYAMSGMICAADDTALNNLSIACQKEAIQSLNKVKSFLN